MDLSGSNISRGIVAKDYIDPDIARDSEVMEALKTHTDLEGNPHGVTAAEIWAADAEHEHPASDITSGRVSALRIDTSIARDSEVSDAVNAHSILTNNPHDVTVEQIGAAYERHTHYASEIITGTAPGAATAAESRFRGGPAYINHSHSGSHITIGTVSERQIDQAIARDTEVISFVRSHTSDKENPHDLSAAQLGAAETSHEHPGDDITSGTVAESYIDDAIARDSEVSSHTTNTSNPAHSNSRTDRSS